MPFVVNRLPKALLDKLCLLVLLGPSATAQFEFHLTNWLSETAAPNGRPVLPELEKLRGKKILFNPKSSIDNTPENIDSPGWDASARRDDSTNLRVELFLKRRACCHVCRCDKGQNHQRSVVCGCRQ